MATFLGFAKKFLMWLAIYLGVGAMSWLSLMFVFWVIGRPLSKGVLLQVMVASLALIFLPKIINRFYGTKLSALPDAVREKYSGSLERLSKENYQFQFRTSKNWKEVPVPYVIGKFMTFTPKSLELSPTGLDWWIRAEQERQKSDLRQAGILTLVLLVPMLASMAAVERFGMSAWWYLVIPFAFVASFWYCVQFDRVEAAKADRIVTQSPEDFEAAREALSHAYRYEKSLKWSEWHQGLNPSVLKRRAAALGIELESDPAV